MCVANCFQKATGFRRKEKEETPVLHFTILSLKYICFSYMEMGDIKKYLSSGYSNVGMNNIYKECSENIKIDVIFTKIVINN